MSKLELSADTYKTPSTDVMRHRREFYSLWKRCDDQIVTWLDRVQNQIDRCEFPSVLSRKYLLLDKFVCELDDNERAFVQSVDIWTLENLKGYFNVSKENTGHRVNENTATSKSVDQNLEVPLTSSLLVAVRCEPVSVLSNCALFIMLITHRLSNYFFDFDNLRSTTSTRKALREKELQMK